MDIFILILLRDLRLSFRRWNELAMPLLFFIIIASLFPLASSPEISQLRDYGGAVIWISALLSSLLALDGLFRVDAEDGSMEQLILSPTPLGVIVLAKIIAHWIVSGVPLVIVSPLLALSFYLPLEALPVFILAIALATPILSVLAAIGAALTVSLRGGGALIGLLMLPMMVPVLIFGTWATDAAVQGENPIGALLLLASLAILSISLGPLAAAGAVKVAME
ncbi:MAG: heme exporter protein CcmB [Gammaproteobacteria bacterium]|nr:heme exporter protein CcmB [Gammaproteobacteria bacterium]MBD07567.1 heme exporter protein CcmB [Gammaproteobacteria bacterium]|tara:strand:+ start:551 stop:1216 length:666 start_codon:yes stop_codon:yes gene_type:complete